MEIVLFLLLLFQCFLMLGLFLFGIISIYFLINSKFMCCAPPIPSYGKVKTAMLESASQVLLKQKGQLIMDLGSGWGSLLLPLAKKFPQHRFVGIEYGIIPYFTSKFRARKLKNVFFYHKNFFDADISKADVIFIFLLSRTMPRIRKKCQAEAKKGALIYVNRFPIPNLKLWKKFFLGTKYDTYFIYKI